MKLLPIICRSAALGSPSLALAPLSRLIYSTAMSLQSSSSSATSPAGKCQLITQRSRTETLRLTLVCSTKNNTDTAVYRALLHRAQTLLEYSNRRLSSQEIANLANAIGCLVESVDVGDMLLLNDLSQALLVWETESSLTSLGSLDLAKFVGGLVKISNRSSSSLSSKKTPVEEWAQGSRLMARITPRLPGLHLRSLSTVFKAMVAFKVVPIEDFIEKAREAIALLTTSSSIGGQPVDGQLRHDLMQDMIQLVAMASSSAMQHQPEPSVPVVLQHQTNGFLSSSSVSSSSLGLGAAGGLAASNPSHHYVQEREKKEALFVSASHHACGDKHITSKVIDGNAGEGGVRMMRGASSSSSSSIASLGCSSSSSHSQGSGDIG